MGVSKPKWTAEQRAAIDLRGQLLVAAAAGSGKTAVLVERLIHRITDPEEPVDVDRFLVVTFTKAAANEMRERIGKALDNVVFHKQETEEVERLLRQRSLLQRASITTLHSFCLDLIRKYFYQLELDPAFRIADQAEADLMSRDMVEDLFETRYEQEDQDFLKLVDAFGSDRDDQPLMEYILRLYEFAYSQAQPAVWLGELGFAYMWDNIESLMQSPWGQAVCQGLLDRVGESLDLLKRAEQITQRSGGPFLYAEVLQDDINRVGLLNRALYEGNWAKIEAQFQSAVDFPKLPAIRSKAKKKPVAKTDSEILELTSTAEQAETDESSKKILQEETKKLRDEAKKKLNSLKAEVFVYPIEHQLPALWEMGAMAKTLGNLVREFAQVYAAAKRHYNVLDFTDLEHFALRLLEEEGETSSIAQELKEYFAEVMVDEYQDINPVQERILQLVSRQEESPNLFMVGDVKQSIYRFRMADPSLFLAKYRDLPHWHPDSPGDLSLPEIVIDLNRNFRSRLEVVEGVNFLFRQIMTKDAGEILYDDQAALQYGASFVSGQDQICTAEGPIEVHLIDPKSIKSQLTAFSSGASTLNTSEDSRQEDYGENDRNYVESSEGSTEGVSGTSGAEEEVSPGTEDALSTEDLDKTRIEARLICERIHCLVQEAEFVVYDKELKDFRPVRYSDIVILMRSYSAVAPIYVEELQNADIPVYAETTTGYFGATEVETMLSLLKIIDNPHLDIPLASVLRSPLVGLNGSELGKLRMMFPEGDFYEALALAVRSGLDHGSLSSERVKDLEKILGLYAESLPQRLEKAQEVLSTAPGLKDKITDFWLKLQTWRTHARRTSLAGLLWFLYEETGYLAYVGTLPAGVQRQANLRVLYDRASRFEATRYRGLFRFLRFLERFRGQGKDLGNARALGENENVVRLLTVHASKGLEFPVVFVVGLGRTFNTRGLMGKMLLHSKLGMGMPIIDVVNNVRYPSLIQYAVKQCLAQEALAEELRILYVALTRAKERLFLYGTIDNLDKTLLKWQRTSEWEEVSLPEGQLRSAKCFLDWIGPALARHPQHLFGEAEGESALVIPEINSRWEVYLHRSLTSLLKEESKDERVEIAFSKSIDESSEKDLSESIDQSQSKKTDEKYYKAGDSSEDETVELWFSEVKRRLSWQYPHLNSVRQVAKASVSEMKRQYNWHINEETSPLPSFMKHSDSVKRPKFMQKAQPLTAAERGTALHTAMQHIPFKEWATHWPTLTQSEQLNNVIEFLCLLERREILSTEQKGSIQSIQIVQFLNTPLGQRLFSAEQILREVPFTLTFPSEGQSNILIQGVIDAVIIRTDELHRRNAEILDYKTDSFRTNNSGGTGITDSVSYSNSTDSTNGEVDPEQILQKRYALQLSLYALAVERLLKTNVTRCTLYSFTLGREYNLPFGLTQLMIEELLI